MAEPARYLSFEDRTTFTPVYAVWEITLACDLKCQHCGSRAGKRRPDELSTEECLDLVRQMARLGTREVTLIGGEAYLRRDWLEIIREIRLQGMNCTLQSGGLHLNEARIKQAADAGLQGAGVSIDGLPELHDRLRGVKGSYDAAFAALQLLKKYNLQPSVNTQITSEVIPQLRELMYRFIEAGARDWQVQLTVAMGRAADHPELLLQPHEMLVLMPLIAELYTEGLEHGFLMQPGNNIGYFGPYESVWRGKGDDSIHWLSCNAGQNTLGIEADGAIKGCPSLPTSPYTGANIRDLTLEDIWNTTPELSFTRTRTTNDLWGYCGTCYYADVCRAGCTWTTHVLFGRAGNNPYCHHRALEMDKQGLRERIVQTAPAPGTPFDHGQFELVVEKKDGTPLSSEERTRTAIAPATPTGKLVQIKSARQKRVAPKPAATIQAYQERELLEVCRGCNRHVLPGEVTCPHCEGDLKTFERAYEKRMRAARRAYRELLKHLPPM
ncbi:MAG TPA: GDL motif peptide-associated radical SAM/SPASM maturase [Pyrinomonadaceae bacterium]|jgi:Y-X(10)_GDL-associated radical SAM protein|nr:GDL motif peptide-associated radical SAM/SPASM maturase [Pyrinomonadaceae bacterium]